MRLTSFHIRCSRRAPKARGTCARRLHQASLDGYGPDLIHSCVTRRGRDGSVSFAQSVGVGQRETPAGGLSFSITSAQAGGGWAKGLSLAALRSRRLARPCAPPVRLYEGATMQLGYPSWVVEGDTSRPLASSGRPRPHLRQHGDHTIPRGHVRGIVGSLWPSTPIAAAATIRGGYTGNRRIVL